MAASLRTLALPAKALKALGLPARAGLEDARRAHRAMAFRLHPDLGDIAHEAEECARRRAEQMVIANAAREAIELAARQGAGRATWTLEARRQWDESTKKIHLSAMLGNWDEVLDSLSFGVDPNVATPAQGAPPLFYAACMEQFGKASMGRGDEGRLRVLEALASNPSTDLSMKGRAMWAEGRTIYDLVSMGRCHGPALDRLNRGRDAMISMLGQGSLHSDGDGVISFADMTPSYDDGFHSFADATPSKDEGYVSFADVTPSDDFLCFAGKPPSPEKTWGM